MNDSIDELEAIREDWQDGASRPPQVTLASLRRRLSRGWLVAALEALGLMAACALLTVVALDTRGLMGWIYWGFFTVFFLIMATISVRLRLRTLFRDDDSGQAVLAQARRDAVARRTGGAVVLWTCPVVWSFASLWLVADGLLQGMSASAIAGESWPSFAFVTLWCLMAAALGAWLREKGQRQLLELDQLVRELGG
ncbi:MAG: hypothetical protein GVY32_06470 [Gammaproteobacteria bacterium]|jgi:hypothetical protein|nr:hypothetical protein [Gammaproteobacteria bacterium]NBD95412.1 hypothetical protein [Gammaproteobacteria bacterium]